MKSDAVFDKELGAHYSKPGLLNRILSALEQAGVNLNAASSDDFSPFAEFHIGGAGATRELGRLASLRAGQLIIDIGSGLGGPARTLAEQFDVRVKGIDLTEEYCSVATELTKIVGLGARVSFEHGNALNLPFEDAAFDVAWTQQSCMNIASKDQMIAEVSRILKSGGTFVFQEVLAGENPEPLLIPVPWASDAGMSFLWTPRDLKKLIEDYGFIEKKWIDVTPKYIEEYRALAAKTADTNARPILGAHLMLGDRSGEMRKNVVKNLETDRVKVYQGVFIKD